MAKSVSVNTNNGAVTLEMGFSLAGVSLPSPARNFFNSGEPAPVLRRLSPDVMCSSQRDIILLRDDTRHVIYNSYPKATIPVRNDYRPLQTRQNQQSLKVADSQCVQIDDDYGV